MKQVSKEEFKWYYNTARELVFEMGGQAYYEDWHKESKDDYDADEKLVNLCIENIIKNKRLGGNGSLFVINLKPWENRACNENLAWSRVSDISTPTARKEHNRLYKNHTNQNCMLIGPAKVLP
jgi:hypothetical protein